MAQTDDIFPVILPFVAKILLPSSGTFLWEKRDKLLIFLLGILIFKIPSWLPSRSVLPGSRTIWGPGVMSTLQFVENFEPTRGRGGPSRTQPGQAQTRSGREAMNKHNTTSLEGGRGQIHTKNHCFHVEKNQLEDVAKTVFH